MLAKSKTNTRQGYYKRPNSVHYVGQRQSLSVRDKIELSVLHLNVRNLNAKCTQLCQLLHLVNIDFDVIVLSEAVSYTHLTLPTILRV